jgi:hypothetical protein
VKLAMDGEPTAVRVRFTAAEPGARVFTFESRHVRVSW